jgi:CubicO group peptidase (beta-lactamase class C family)
VSLFRAYHRVSAAEHQQWFDTLSVAGYRMISLCVYGPPASARYAAVWVQRAGPAYVAFHNRSAADYQTLVDTLTPQGYVPVLLSATGDFGDATFAGMFEQLHVPWAGRHHVTQAQFDADDGVNGGRGLALREFCCYGSAAAPLVAAVWREASATVHQSTWRFFDRDTYQQLYAAVIPRDNRPFLVTVSDGARYHAIFQDDSIGVGAARHHIDGDAYQREFDANAAQGRMPICVRAAGRSADQAQDLYAAVFAASDLSVPRHWATTGTPHAQYTAVETVVQAFMQAHGVRAATLALGRAGSIVHARGFTWAESGYPVCQPDALFRLASLSKLFAAAAIDTLRKSRPIRQRAAFLAKRIFALLGIVAPMLPGQTADGRSNAITLRHLLEHQGGWVRDSAKPSLHPGAAAGFDPCSGPALRRIGQDLGLNHVVSTRDVARYMYGEPLQYTPGTATLPDAQRYSNFGYLLLGLAVEHFAGKPFHDYLRDSVLLPLGVTDVFVAGSLAPLAREVRYHCVNAVQSVFRPDLDPAWVAEPYGGLATEVSPGSGGLLASAPAVVTTIGQHAVWGSGPRAPGLARIGNMAGTFTCASSRGNGYDWAVLCNGGDGLDDALRGKFVDDIIASVDASF